MTNEATKDTVVRFRMDDITAELLDRARTYVEVNKSKFIRQSIREKAQAIIAEHEATRFSKEDWRMFFDMIENPPEPTTHMQRAAEKYRKTVSTDAV